MERKTFAFRLAAKSPGDTRKWQARDGVARAGCSQWGGTLYYREIKVPPHFDGGVFC